MADEKALDKIDIASELKTLSPLEQKSLELQERATKLTITNKETYVDGKKLKRELVSHRTGVKDLRLTFTRKLDNLKDQFIKKQDEVLAPSIAGEELVKKQLEDWDKAERDRKEAEEKRIAEIVNKFAVMQIGTVDRKTGSLEDVKRQRAAIKMELGLLDSKDRTKVAVKNIVEQTRTWLDECEQYIIDRIEQERVAEEQRLAQEKLDAERKEFEEKKAAEEAEIRSGRERELLEKSKVPDAGMTHEQVEKLIEATPIIASGFVSTAQTEYSPVDTFDTVTKQYAKWRLVIDGTNDTPTTAQYREIAMEVMMGHETGSYEIKENVA